MKFAFLLVFFTHGFSLGNPPAPLNRDPAFMNPSPMNPAPPFFYPNFSGTPYVLPQGYSIQPVCFNPNSPLCFNQWMNQSIPLSVGQSGLPNQFSYFLPTFIPKGPSSFNPEEDSNWQRISLPRLSKKDRYSETRVFYSNKQNPEQIAKVEVNPDTQEQTVILGSVAYVNVEDIEQAEADDSEDSTDSESSQSGAVSSGASSTPSVDSRGVISSGDSESDSVPSGGSQSGTVPSVGSRGAVSSGSSPTPTTDISMNDLQTARDTEALPGQAVREIKPGCFVIDKKLTSTEADHCFECVRQTSENNTFNSLKQNQDFLSKIKTYLSKVSRSSKNKFDNQIPGSLSGANKICAPQETLRLIIDNFEKTCPNPYNGKGAFESFFKDSFCKSCQEGVPIELMMGMMSLESAGRCYAVASNPLEKSAGLFQVDSDQHTCTSRHKKKTPANIKCLKNPINNLNKALDILTDHYAKTNPNPNPKAECKDWMSLSPAERDSWRRGVSAYNGGPGWVTRAIRSGRNSGTLYDTSYLSGTHRERNAKEKKDTASWEELRLLYFIEKLSPGNSGAGPLPKCRSFLQKDHGGTGRQLCLTVSNLAHTEAILGREISGSPPGMIEVWAQYKKDFLKENPIQCSN